jgi:hypothetical protein
MAVDEKSIIFQPSSVQLAPLVADGAVLRHQGS